MAKRIECVDKAEAERLRARLDAIAPGTFPRGTRARTEHYCGISRDDGGVWGVDCDDFIEVELAKPEARTKSRLRTAELTELDAKIATAPQRIQELTR